MSVRWGWDRHASVQMVLEEESKEVHGSVKEIEKCSFNFVHAAIFLLTNYIKAFIRGVPKAVKPYTEHLNFL